MIHLEDSLGSVKGIGVVTAQKLLGMGLGTVEDLLYYFPFRYDDYSVVSSMGGIVPNQLITIDAELSELKNIFTRNGKKLTKGVLIGSFGSLNVIWFNQPYLVKNLPVGSLLRLSGKVQEFSNRLTLVSPKWQRIAVLSTQGPLLEVPIPPSDEGVSQNNLTPVYSETSGITSKWLREKISFVLGNLYDFPQEYLPAHLLEKNGLVGVEQLIKKMHLPDSMEDVEQSRKRLAYEEIFFSQLRTSLKRKEWQQQRLTFQLDVSSEWVGLESGPSELHARFQKFIHSLPFTLTNAQKRVVGEILHDMQKIEPMNRLVEGDVGSGKTVVAALAMYAAYLCGYRSVIMAPTQILAQQHFVTITRLLEPLGLKIQLVSGADKKSERSKSADIFVGTHALLFMEEQIERLALTVIDEQHRFGVEQRAKLRSMHGLTHLLSMTATPIPRTLALTLYGDLDLSVIDELPPGRKPVKTWVVPLAKREGAYEWIRKFVKETRDQVFLVCPFIQPSESDETIKAATAEYESLQQVVFPDLRIGLLHGQMKVVQKDAVLLDFRDKKYDILVCTPVVEVGIDIPAASVIVIEAADRFGLAQLHQFRGRVGRAGQQAYCLLFPTVEKQEESRRLAALEKTNSGIELAEIDLKIRGSGNIFGVEQHGRSLFHYADFFDVQALQAAKNDSNRLLSDDPDLAEHNRLRLRLAYSDRKIDAN